MSLFGDNGADQLFVDDSSDLTGRQVTLTPDHIGAGVGDNYFGGGSLQYDSFKTVSLLTGTGADTIIVAGSQPAVDTAVNGNGGGDTLIGPDGSNMWNVEGVNQGTLNSTLSFSNVENLRGGSLGDRFLLKPNGQLSGSVRGGGGQDTLDYGHRNSPIIVNLATMTAPSVASFLEIENVVGGSSGADVVIGPNQFNAWKINAANAGSVQTGQQRMDFSGFENLTGGNSTDVFSFLPTGQLAGQIDGGSGLAANTLDYSALSSGVQVELAAGSASHVHGGISNIDNVAGSTGDDTLRGDSGKNQLDGGPGNDILIGGAGIDMLNGGDGRDLLIGGVGADQLAGNAGDDILIAGTTSWDANDSALMHIMNEWTSARSYATRVAEVTAGAGLTAGFRLNGDDGNRQTVFNDNNVDTLLGGADDDWFLANKVADNGGLLDQVQDLTGHEVFSDTDW